MVAADVRGGADQLDPIGITFVVPETQLGPLLAATRAGDLEVEAITPGSARGTAASLPYPG